MNRAFGGVIDVAGGGQLSDQGLVDRWLGSEVEVADGPGGGEVREPHPGVPAALLGGRNLDT